MQIGFRPLPTAVAFSSNKNIDPPRNPQPVTYEQAKALKSKIPTLLMGPNQSEFMRLYESKFNVNGIGITKVGGSFAVSVNTESLVGREEVLNALATQPGFTKNVPEAPIGSLGAGDEVVSIASEGVQIPIVVRFIGRIVAG